MSSMDCMVDSGWGDACGFERRVRQLALAPLLALRALKEAASDENVRFRGL